MATTFIDFTLRLRRWRGVWRKQIADDRNNNQETTYEPTNERRHGTGVLIATNIPSWGATHASCAGGWNARFDFKPHSIKCYISRVPFILKSFFWPHQILLLGIPSDFCSCMSCILYCSQIPQLWVSSHSSFQRSDARVGCNHYNTYFPHWPTM